MCINLFIIIILLPNNKTHILKINSENELIVSKQNNTLLFV